MPPNIGVTPKLGAQETLDELLKLFRRQRDVQWEEVLKSLTTATFPGTATAFQPFNLDMVGKLLLPQLTPLQNEGAYGVKAGETGDSREYRGIVAKNTAKQSGLATAATQSIAVTGTGRAPTVDYTFITKKKNFAKYAPEAAITWELYRSSGPFNALGKATIASLITAKELEERHMLGDAGSSPLGTTGTPVGTPSTSGGTLAAGTWTVSVAALNYWGAWYFSDNPTADLANTAGVVPTEAIAGTSAGIVTTGTTSSIAMTVPAKKGAWGYVWYIKLGAGAYNLAGPFFSTIPKITITSAGTIVASTISTVDGSLLDLQSQTLVWDGFFQQIALDSDIPGEYAALGGAALTTTGAGSGVAELETQFQALYQKWFLSPEYLIMSSKTLQVLSNIAIGSAAPAYRLLVETGGDGRVKAGTVLGSVRNQYAGTEVKIIAHPLMFDGKIISYTKTIDYPDSGVGTNMELHCSDHWLQDFFARITDVAPPGPWAIKTYGAPTMYFPRSCGVIDEILT